MQSRWRAAPLAALIALFSALTLSVPAEAQPAAGSKDFTPSVGQEGKDVIWVPTPQSLVDRMLQMADTKSTDFVIDLGAGD
ncbi:MAG: SAM-dependent methyltransferase, partial [Burkholderiales bacterium]